jgi:predicted nucleotide-binding protein
MGDMGAAMAKLAGTKKAVGSALAERGGRTAAANEIRRTFDPDEVAKYFNVTVAQLDVLRHVAPDLYSDFHEIETTPTMEVMGVLPNDPHRMFFSRPQMERLERDIDQIFEVRAASQHATPEVREIQRRVFISHGRSKDWYEVQQHIERDLGLKSMELAQEPSRGQTVIEKLVANTNACDSAVIVMSGDDVDDEGKLRVRENVMHEIGYFQGAYGRSRVVLLHEEDVNVPTNLGGIVYVSYPKGLVKGTFGELDRELKAIYGS